MVDGYAEQRNESLIAIIDAVFQSMSNQMAIAKAVGTGKAASPEEFYKPTIKKHRPPPVEGVNKEGFEMLKKNFVRNGKA